MSSNLLKWINSPQRAGIKQYFWDDISHRMPSFLMSTISNPATNTFCKYHRSKPHGKLWYFHWRFPPDRNRCLTKVYSFFDSPSVADKEQCYFYFHLVGINTQICRSSISNPVGDKKETCRMPLYNDLWKIVGLKIYIPPGYYKFLELKLVNSFKVIHDCR